MTVLGVALPGVVTGLSAQSQQLVRSMCVQTAVDIADARLVTVVADNEGKGYESVVARAYPSETVVRDGATYRCSTEVGWVIAPTLATSRTDEGLKRVRVTVRGPNGVEVTLQTILSDHAEAESTDEKPGEQGSPSTPGNGRRTRGGRI